MRRTGERNEPRRVTGRANKSVCNDLGHCKESSLLDALGNVYDYLILRDKRCRFFRRAADKHRRDRKQDNILVSACLSHACCISDLRRQDDPGQIRVTAGRLKLLNLARKHRPHGNIMPVQLKHPCKRNTPCSGTENSYIHLFSPQSHRFRAVYL